MPQFVPVLHRKLKPNCTYEDFYQAWLPPGLNGKDPTNKTQDPKFYIVKDVNLLGTTLPINRTNEGK